MNATTEPIINQSVTTIPRKRRTITVQRFSTRLEAQKIHTFKSVLIPKISNIMKDINNGKGSTYRLNVQAHHCTQLYQTVYKMFVLYTQNSILFNNLTCIRTKLSNVSKFFSISNNRIDILSDQAILSSYGLCGKSTVKQMIKAMQKFRTAYLRYRYECVHKLVLLTCIKQLPLEVVRMIAMY